MIWKWTQGPTSLSAHRGQLVKRGANLSWPLFRCALEGWYFVSPSSEGHEEGIVRAQRGALFYFEARCNPP